MYPLFLVLLSSFYHVSHGGDVFADSMRTLAVHTSVQAKTDSGLAAKLILKQVARDSDETFSPPVYLQIPAPFYLRRPDSSVKPQADRQDFSLRTTVQTPPPTPPNTITHLFAPQSLTPQLYILFGLYGVWLFLKCLFPGYHSRMFRSGWQSLLTFSSGRLSAFATHFQFEGILFRVLSLAIFAYTLWIYLSYRVDLHKYVSDQDFLFAKLFVAITGFYICRLFLIWLLKDRALIKIQVFFHTFLISGMSIFLLLYVTVIITTRNTKPQWHDNLITALPYVVSYMFFRKACLIIREYRKNGTYSPLALLYLVITEFMFPTVTIYLAILGDNLPI